MKVFQLPYCSECGEVRVPHTLYKFQAWGDLLLASVEDKLSQFGERTYPSFVDSGLDRYLRPLFELLAKWRLASFRSEFDPRDSIRTKALFDGAKATGVRLRQFRLFDIGENGTFVAEKDGKEIVFAVMPRPRGFRSPSLSWMDDKGKLKAFLRPRGIPIADGDVAKTAAQALEIFERIGPPVITKPHKTSRGLHTTIGIHTREELLRAFRITKQISPNVIVEKELQGIVHRVTLIGGKVAGIVERDYPHVVGDGVANVRELLEKENAEPYRDNFNFFRIDANDRADFQLQKQGLTWDSVPAKNQQVILNDKVSRRHGTLTIDVTDEVHPENTALFEKIARELGDPLIGVDFMISSMQKSWKEQPCSGLIEVNAMPYIDLHLYPYKGKSREVAKDLWEYVFAHSS